MKKSTTIWGALVFGSLLLLLSLSQFKLPEKKSNPGLSKILNSHEENSPPGNNLPQARELSIQNAPEKSGSATSPTGDEKLDEIYRTNPAWAKRWDKYKVAFVRAQSMRQQPPSPPEPPSVDEERFRISRPPQGFPNSP